MKIVKVIGYLLAEDDVDEADVALEAKQVLGGRFDCVEKPFKAESTFIGKTWNDETGEHILENHPLNRFDCSMETCEMFFQKGENALPKKRNEVER